MQRPALTPQPQSGLLRAEHFQMAYATNDIDRAQAVFAARYGIGRWARLEGPLEAGGRIRVELAWVGTIMYELMTASGEGSAIYMGRLPAGDGFQLKHHHLGYLIADEAGWAALIDRVAREGHDMPHLSENRGFISSCFVDAPELGHYLEYVWPAPAGLAFFQSVPGN